MTGCDTRMMTRPLLVPQVPRLAWAVFGPLRRETFPTPTSAASSALFARAITLSCSCFQSCTAATASSPCPAARRATSSGAWARGTRPTCAPFCSTCTTKSCCSPATLSSWATSWWATCLPLIQPTILNNWLLCSTKFGPTYPPPRARGCTRRPRTPAAIPRSCRSWQTLQASRAWRASRFTRTRGRAARAPTRSSIF